MSQHDNIRQVTDLNILIKSGQSPALPLKSSCHKQAWYKKDRKLGNPALPKIRTLCPE